MNTLDLISNSCKIVKEPGLPWQECRFTMKCGQEFLDAFREDFFNTFAVIGENVDIETINITKLSIPGVGLIEVIVGSYTGYRIYAAPDVSPQESTLTTTTKAPL